MQESAKKCWKYTWMGAETEKVNSTATCSDVDGEDVVRAG
jgi:hypothetical protein